MPTMDELRSAKQEYKKDPVAYASGRLSHAIRHGLPEDVVALRRRELAGAQIEKFLSRMLEECAPTKEHAKILCKMLTSAAA